MGTIDVLIGAAIAAGALFALATFAGARARARTAARLNATLGHIGDSVAHLTETLATLSAAGPFAIDAPQRPADVPPSLDLAEIADAVATSARRLPGVDAAALRATLENGETIVSAVDVPEDAARRLELGPPDGRRWETTHVAWARSAPGLAGAFTDAVAVPVSSTDGEIGLLLAFSRAGALPPATETALLRLAATARAPLANARRFRSTLELVRTDALTGLRNRRAYDEDLALEIERARRGNAPLSLVIVDLDDFGRVNKEHSLQVGDEVLTTFAGVVRSTARTVDVVCRRGGEEFAVVLPDTDCLEAQRFTDRLRTEVTHTDFPVIGRLTFSAGLTRLRPEDTAATIDERASRLQNQSKQAGKNRVTHDCG